MAVRKKKAAAKKKAAKKKTAKKKTAKKKAAPRKKKAAAKKKPVARKAKAAGGKQSDLERVREIVFAWPEVWEKISHGSPTWWGGKKTFANIHDGHYDELGCTSLWIKTTHDGQADLVASDPDTFYVPKYVGPSGWVGLRLGRRKDCWALAEGLLEEGYRMVAPKRAIAELDAQQGRFD